MSGFDAERARLAGPDQFLRFRVRGLGEPLNGAKLPADRWLIEIERHDERHALLAHEMVYHHVAQGMIGKEPWLASF